LIAQGHIHDAADAETNIKNRDGNLYASVARNQALSFSAQHVRFLWRLDLGLVTVSHAERLLNQNAVSVEIYSRSQRKVVIALHALKLVYIPNVGCAVKFSINRTIRIIVETVVHTNVVRHAKLHLTSLKGKHTAKNVPELYPGNMLRRSPNSLLPEVTKSVRVKKRLGERGRLSNGHWLSGNIRAAVSIAGYVRARNSRTAK